MLQKLDATHMNRLRVADYLNDLDPDDFHMNYCNRCIAGHIYTAFLGRADPDHDWSRTRDAAAAFLGIGTHDANMLFAPGSFVYSKDHTPDPRDAARVMRYLAATDIVDWGVGCRG